MGKIYYDLRDIIFSYDFVILGINIICLCEQNLFIISVVTVWKEKSFKFSAKEFETQIQKVS